LQLSILGPWISKENGKRFKTFIKTPRQSDLEFIKDLLESGMIKPVIDRQFDLSEAPEAVHYVEKGHTQGKVVLSVKPGETQNLRLVVNS